jgi:hypothetical protein
MDDKTRELRDIFVDVAGEETVTEPQAEARGSLADEDEEHVAERLEGVIARMRGRYEFDSGFGEDSLYAVVRYFYDEESDETIAAVLDATPQEVFVARTDLHLLREEDIEAPFDLDELRELLDAGYTLDEIAAELDADESTVRRYRRVVHTRRESRRVNGRFRDEFEEILTDVDLGTRLTEDVRETGLEDATDGMETDVSF